MVVILLIDLLMEELICFITFVAMDSHFFEPMVPRPIHSIRLLHTSRTTVVGCRVQEVAILI